MSNRKCCFKAGLPVSGDDFFGRHELLHRIQQTLEGQTLLVGQRRIGKSSILAQIQFLSARAEPGQSLNHVVPVKCDGQLHGGENRGFEALLTDVTRRLARWANEHATEVPVPNFAGDHDPMDIARVLLDSVQSSGYKVLLLIDEVDSLAADAALKLRAFTHETRIPILAVCYKNPNDVLDKAGSAWWNYFSISYVPLFTDSEARQMLSVLSHKSGKQFSDAESSVLIEVLGRFPYYLQVAGTEIFLSSEFPVASPSERVRAFKIGLGNVGLKLQWFFQAAFSNVDDKSKQILLKIATGSPVTQTPELLELAARGIVTLNEKQPCDLSSTLFREYLQQMSSESRNDASSADKTTHPWRAIVPDVAGKVIGTAFEKAIEVAAGKYF